ncbi:hypothetical protein ACQPXT_13395 [Streptomyces sp. CA-100214]
MLIFFVCAISFNLAVAAYFGLPVWEKLREDLSSDINSLWADTFSIVGSIVVSLLLIFYLAVVLAEKREDLSQRRTQVVRFLLARRYALVYECVAAIHACAAARQGGEGRPARLREISKQLAAVRREVLSAHSSRGSVPLLSHRRKRLKEHQRRVVAALQDLEAQLDQIPGHALRELAEALLTIADRYCQGRSGALLDEERLTGIPRQRNWDVLRYLIALLMAAGGITAIAVTKLVPESAESYIYLIVVVVSFVVAFGRNFRRAIDVMGVIAGQP